MIIVERVFRASVHLSHFWSGKSKGGLSKGGLGPKGANWAKKGPFGAISALPPWLWGAEELVPIGPEKALIGPEKVPICPEKARFRRKDFPPIFSENLGLKPPFVSPPLDFPNLSHFRLLWSWCPGVTFESLSVSSTEKFLKIAIFFSVKIKWSWLTSQLCIKVTQKLKKKCRSSVIFSQTTGDPATERRKWPVQMRGSAVARPRCRTEYTHGRTQCEDYPAKRWYPQW